MSGTKIIINGLVTIKSLPLNIMGEMKKDLTIDNPKYEKLIKAGQKTYDLDPFIPLYIPRGSSSIIVPRGYMNRAMHLLRGKETTIIDNTVAPELDEEFQFTGDLRGYQEEASVACTKRRYGILDAATGSGKTVMALSTIPIRNTTTLIIVHNTELLHQWQERIKTFLGYDCGLLGNGHNSIKNLTVGIINTVAKRASELAPMFGYCIYDECFLAGTLVDGIPIKDVKVGDYVNSRNDRTGKIELKKVLHVFKNRIKDDLLKMSFSNGAITVNTKGHPFYSEGSYLTADSLRVNSTVHAIVPPLLYENLRSNYAKLHLHHLRNRTLYRRCASAYYTEGVSRLQSLQKKRTVKESNSLLQSMPISCAKQTAVGSTERSPLLKGMLTKITGQCPQKIRKIPILLEQRVRQCSNDRKQSYAPGSDSRKNENYQKDKWHVERMVWGKRREWSIHNSARKISCSSGMANGSISTHEGVAKQVRRKPCKSIQTRCWESKVKNWNRNRWAWAHKSEQTSTRFEERKSLKRLRVVSAEIYKCPSRPESNSVFDDGFTYNIEVEGNNNYFANGILVHNCHRTIGGTWLDTINTLYPRYHLGCTATSYRSDGTTRALYAVVGPKFHTVDKTMLEETGAIAVPEIIKINTNVYIPKDTEMTYSQVISELCSCAKRNILIAESVYKEFMHHKDPILVVSDRKEHCDDLYTLINAYQFLNPVIIHGGVKKADRKRLVEEFKKGKYNVLIATVSLIGEGFDSPSLGALFMATPIKFNGRLLQVIGRILRPSGNIKPRVYDFRDYLVTVVKYSGFSRDRMYKANKWE